MASTIFNHIKLIIGLMFLCTFIHVIHTRPMIIDDGIGLFIPDDALINSYGPLDELFNNEIPLENLYYPKKNLNHYQVHLDKRIIMLPRVGRRSIRST